MVTQFNGDDDNDDVDDIHILLNDGILHRPLGDINTWHRTLWYQNMWLSTDYTKVCPTYEKHLLTSKVSNILKKVKVIL